MTWTHWDRWQFSHYTFVGVDSSGMVEFRTYSRLGLYSGAKQQTLGMDGIE